MSKQCKLSKPKYETQVRRLELPMLLRIYFETIIRASSNPLRAPCVDGTEPLLRAATHREHRMAPKELVSEIDRLLKDIPTPQFADRKTSNISRITLLQATAESNFCRYGYEEDELNYITAEELQPNYTTAFRRDFKLQLTEDGQKITVECPAAGMSVMIQATLPISVRPGSKAPDNGLILEISSLHGFTGFAEWKSKEPEEGE